MESIKKKKLHVWDQDHCEKCNDPDWCADAECSESSVLHVIPRNDLKEHISSSDCECKPIYRDKTFVHNAWDNREVIETVNELLQ